MWTFIILAFIVLLVIGAATRRKAASDKGKIRGERLFSYCPRCDAMLDEQATSCTSCGLPHVPKQSIAPGYPLRVYMRWPDAPQEIPRIKKDEIGVGLLWKVIYQDAFYIWHCEKFAAHYEQAPIAAFVGTNAVPVCHSTVRSVRFNRVCVPSADRTFGAWIETWEEFLVPTTDVPVPDNDPTPCQRKGQRTSNNESLATTRTPKVTRPTLGRMQ